jgi:hypothetical protein
MSEKSMHANVLAISNNIEKKKQEKEKHFITHFIPIT